MGRRTPLSKRNGDGGGQVGFVFKFSGKQCFKKKTTDSIIC